MVLSKLFDVEHVLSVKMEFSLGMKKANLCLNRIIEPS